MTDQPPRLAPRRGFRQTERASEVIVAVDGCSALDNAKALMVGTERSARKVGTETGEFDAGQRAGDRQARQAAPRRAGSRPGLRRESRRQPAVRARRRRGHTVASDRHHGTRRMRGKNFIGVATASA